MPYEVRGGFAIRAQRLWPFVQQVRRAERGLFGAELHEFGAELKGSALLDRDRFRWAGARPPSEPEEARALARGFLVAGRERRAPTAAQFSAYGQACLAMADAAFDALRAHAAVVIASTIPRGAPRRDDQLRDIIRKDQSFLFERYFYLLEDERGTGVIVHDSVEESADSRITRRLEKYFRETAVGQERARRIVPTPFFVASRTALPIQVADIVIYCVNWGFRLPDRGMSEPVRGEIATRYADPLRQLQLRTRRASSGSAYDSFGIVYVPDPDDVRKH
jgi:hypothetical protein